MDKKKNYISFNIKLKKHDYQWKIIILINLILLLIIFINYNSISKENKKNRNLEYIKKYNITFIIIKYKYKVWGLFTYFRSFSLCINTYINKGYIPIIDLLSYPNIFNAFNVSSLNKNPWEYFFEQPFSFTLEEVKKNAKKIIFIDYNQTICNEYRRNSILYNSRAILDYWQMIVLKYIPIKKDITIESNIIIKKLFKNKNKNVLGILLRGTDYIAKKPRKHHIQPETEIVINDTIEADKKNNYDYIFITTEDAIIFEKFKNRFANKLKYYKDKFIKYNYTEKKFLAYNKNITGIHFQKIYLINIIILSNCIDIISSNAGGLWGAMIFSRGFRNYKIYNLGLYK